MVNDVNTQRVNRFEYSHLKAMEKSFYKLFAEWHVAMRKKMKLTRPEFAEMMFLSHHTVQGYEYGKRVPVDIDAYMKDMNELAKACHTKENKPKQKRIGPSFKVAMLDPESGERLRIFANTQSAADYVKRSKPAIQKACAGLHKVSGGYMWEYVKD